ncbi:MAG: segregation and condensation protein A [Oscillospiraceae bacterium]
MSVISFKLESFEGPLDLLLHLISKHKLNIYDIEISLLLDQYLEYIDSIEEQDFDMAGDFLAMAAKLVYIKTCSLLPQPEEAQEMKKELEGTLLEYSVCKQAADNLRRQCIYGDVFIRPPEKLPVNKVFTGNIDPQKLVDAYMGMSAKARTLKPVKPEQFSPIVSSRIVTVTSKIVFVLKKLYKTGECLMSELYDGVKDKSARVATFLAVLELTKTGRVYLNDDNSVIKFNCNSPRKHKKQDAEKETAAIQTQSAPAPVEPETVSETTLSEQIAEEAQADECSDDFSDEEAIGIVDEPAPDEDEKSAEYEVSEKPAWREKYALEARVTGHMLAVPVFAFGSALPAQTAEVKEQTAEEEILVLKKQEEKIKLHKKQNRFSSRWRWGCPLEKGNCWVYGRERV